MKALKKLTGQLSDHISEEEDANDNRAFARVLGLGNNITVPSQTDSLASEDEESILADLDKSITTDKEDLTRVIPDSHTQESPVDIINLIMPSGQRTSHVSSRPSSSKTGDLKRPSITTTRRSSQPMLAGEDVYEIDTPPEPVTSKIERAAKRPGAFDPLEPSPKQSKRPAPSTRKQPLRGAKQSRPEAAKEPRVEIPALTKARVDTNGRVDVPTSDPRAEIDLQPDHAQNKDQMSSVAPENSRSPDDQDAEPQASSASQLENYRVPSTTLDKAQLSAVDEGDGLFTFPTRAEQPPAEVLERDTAAAAEHFSDGHDVEVEQEDTEVDMDPTDDSLIPKELLNARQLARTINRAANEIELARDCWDLHVLKDYISLRKILDRLKSEEDYSEVDRVIGMTSLITKRAVGVFQTPGWNREAGLRHVYARVLPTLVRMLYISLNYHLFATGTMDTLSKDQLKASRKIAKAIIDIYGKVEDNPRKPSLGFNYLRDVKSMIARIKKVCKELEKQEVDIALSQIRERNSQRHTTRRQEETLESDERRNLDEWKQTWYALHVQRRGVEFEGRIFWSDERDEHLRLIPLADVYLATTNLPLNLIDYPEWDLVTQITPLMEGLEEALKTTSGPNVYRHIFQKLCRRGGPLVPFNVSEIIERAVSMQRQLCLIAAEYGEQVEQWILDIPDPRKPPEGVSQEAIDAFLGLA